jgi:hypothetical protein
VVAARRLQDNVPRLPKPPPGSFFHLAVSSFGRAARVRFAPRLRAVAARLIQDNVSHLPKRPSGSFCTSAPGSLCTSHAGQRPPLTQIAVGFDLQFAVSLFGRPSQVRFAPRLRSVAARRMQDNVPRLPKRPSGSICTSA